MSEPKDLLKSEGHDYDGIREYDNPLPRWWVYLFYITIIWSFWYVSYYTAKEAALKGVVADKAGATAWSSAKYEVAVLEAKAREKKMNKARPRPQGLAALAKDSKAIARGQNLFMANCIACHGADGGGLVGPNLTDEFWIHGSSLDDIRKVISAGVLEKGMVAWEPVLGKEKVDDLVVFVASLEGTTPATPKAPEGVKKGG